MDSIKVVNEKIQMKMKRSTFIQTFIQIHGKQKSRLQFNNLNGIFCDEQLFGECGVKNWAGF